jgi:hypothetical protein
MFLFLVLLLSFGHTTNFKVQIMRQILFFKYFLNTANVGFSQNKVVVQSIISRDAALENTTS